MSVKSRWILLAATVLAWAGWLGMEWVRLYPGIQTGIAHDVLTIGMRLLVVVASLACVMAWLVSPIMASARVALLAVARSNGHHRHLEPAERAVAGEVVPIQRYRNWVDN